MVTQSLEDDPELNPSIPGIDHTPSHIVTLLVTQTNDQLRTMLADQKIIIELINKNNELKDLLENNEKLLKDQKDMMEYRPSSVPSRRRRVALRVT
jgi:hypothetical protein